MREKVTTQEIQEAQLRISKLDGLIKPSMEN